MYGGKNSGSRDVQTLPYDIISFPHQDLTFLASHSIVGLQCLPSSG